MAHLELWARQRLSAADVEFDAGPGAGEDLAIADPLMPPIGCERARHRAGDASFAQRSELVRADVRQREKLAVEVEDAYFHLADLNDLVAADRKVGKRTEDMFRHLRRSPRRAPAQA